MKIRKITPGELLRLKRHRGKQSRRRAAAAYGISVYRLRRWESGDERPPPEVLASVSREVDVRNLPEHEVCFLLRVRAGITARQLAAVLECSDWWLCQMEHGGRNPGRLVAYWQSRTRPWRPTAAAV